MSKVSWDSYNCTYGLFSAHFNMVYQLVLSPPNPASTLLPDTSSQNNIWITFPTLKFSWFTNSFRGGKKVLTLSLSIAQDSSSFRAQCSLVVTWVCLPPFITLDSCLPLWGEGIILSSILLLIRLFFIVGTKIPVILLTLLIPVTLS